MTFSELNIIQPVLNAIHKEGYTEPTPIQAAAIPALFDGTDLLCSAQTGTGKTAAFAVPIIQGIYNNRNQQEKHKSIKALILAPTRELAGQIKDSFNAYSKNTGLKTAVVYGGVTKRNQIVALKKGIDILVATPGRLLDLMNSKFVHLDKVDYFVLDEVDRMLDMGFIIDVNKIVAKLPVKRQTMLFSATIPLDIMPLANQVLNKPKRIEMSPEKPTLEAITQSVYSVDQSFKTALLLELLQDKTLTSGLVFTRTKHGANKLVKALIAAHVSADAIHGNKTQRARQTALNQFKSKRIRVLVATDIAARGIDIDALSHVINYDLPETPETYIHRIGRTGRAGFNGKALSFCGKAEKHLLRSIQKHINMVIPYVEEHPYKLKSSPSKPGASKRSEGGYAAAKRKPRKNQRHHAKPNNDQQSSNRSEYKKNTRNQTPAQPVIARQKKETGKTFEELAYNTMKQPKENRKNTKKNKKKHGYEAASLDKPAFGIKYYKKKSKGKPLSSHKNSSKHKKTSVSKRQYGNA